MQLKRVQGETLLKPKKICEPDEQKQEPCQKARHSSLQDTKARLPAETANIAAGREVEEESVRHSATNSSQAGMDKEVHDGSVEFLSRAVQST